MNRLLLGGFAVAIIVYLSSLNWRRSVKAALIIVVLEGALRKWALPQASQLIYFLKDFILIGAYLKFFFFSQEQHFQVVRQSWIVPILGLGFFWCFVQAFNPSLGSFIIGIFGLKNYFLYVPLLWLVPALFQTEEDLLRFLRSYLLLLIPVGLLAITQFFSPIDSPLNIYAWQDGEIGVAVGGDGKSVRVTGTFSYIAGYTIFLGFCLCLLLPILSFKQPRGWQQLVLAEVLIIAITTFMTAARGLLFTVMLLISCYLALQGLTSFKELFRSIRQFLLPGLLAFGVVSWRFQAAVNSLWLRVTQNQDISNRVGGSFTEVSDLFQLKGLDGYGTGATFQANGFLQNFLGLPAGEMIPVYYESEMGRIALEIGPLGFFLWYGFKLMLLLALWNTHHRLQSPFLKKLALSAFLLQAITFNGQLVYNHTANLYQWFLYSFIFLLPKLDYITWQQTYQPKALHEQSLPIPDSPYQ